MKIFITGGAGLIGSNLVNRLGNSGHKISIFDNFSAGRLDYLSENEASILNGDILNFEDLKKKIKDHDLIIHLAAKGNVVESISEPKENFDVNVLGTLNCLRAAAENGVKKFIFASTGGALMGNTPPPVSEQSLPKPISPYGASKLAAEGYCTAFSESYGLDIVILRFANVYGPNCLHKVGVINKFFSAFDRKETLKIYGDCSRDFIHVDDLTKGIELAVQTKLSGCNTFHLANGAPVKISDLAKIMAKAMGDENYDIVQLPHQSGEVETTFADSTLAKDILGFSSEVSLTEGIRGTINWLKENQSKTD